MLGRVIHLPKLQQFHEYENVVYQKITQESDTPTTHVKENVFYKSIIIEFHYSNIRNIGGILNWTENIPGRVPIDSDLHSDFQRGFMLESLGLVCRLHIGGPGLCIFEKHPR